MKNSVLTKKYFFMKRLFLIAFVLFSFWSYSQHEKKDILKMEFGVWFSSNAEIEILSFGKEDIKTGLDVFVTLPIVKEEKWSIAPCFNFVGMSAGIFAEYVVNPKNEVAIYGACLKKVNAPDGKGIVGIAKYISLGEEKPIEFQIYLEAGTKMLSWNPFVSVGFLFPITTEIKKFTKRE